MATLAGRVALVARNASTMADTGSRAILASVIAPTSAEIGLTVVVAGWFLFGGTLGESSADLVNSVGLIALSAVILFGAYRQIRHGVTSVWLPLLWYRAAMVVYFGAGSLAATWGNAATREMMASFYDFFGHEVVKLNLVITVFHLVLLASAKLVVSVFARRRSAAAGRHGGIEHSNFNMISLGALCLMVGTFVNWLVVLPQVVGWYEFPLFSTLWNLTSLAWIGYFMVTYWALEHRKFTVVAVVIVIAAGECVIGMINMSKLVILIPVIMVGMGFVYQRPALRRLAVFGGILAVVFFALAPMVGYVRDNSQDRELTPTDVLSSYGSYFTDRQAPNERYADVQAGWSRLSYVNAGTFAISQYDRGLPGNSYRYLPIVLIPRAIYPDKPIITDVARELSEEANGNYYSSSTAGLPAEAYWNFGWQGTLLVAAFLGLLFALWSIYSYTVIVRGAWHLFFVVLLGARTAIRVDGAFVSDIVGPIGVAVLAHAALTLLNRFLPNRVTHFIHDDTPATV